MSRAPKKVSRGPSLAGAPRTHVMADEEDGGEPADVAAAGELIERLNAAIDAVNDLEDEHGALIARLDAEHTIRTVHTLDSVSFGAARRPSSHIGTTYAKPSPSCSAAIVYGSRTILSTVLFASL